MRGSHKSTLVTIAAVVAIIAAQAFVINFLGSNNYLPQGSDHWTEDWLIHYFSPRLDKPHKAVAIVTVDPESLEKAGLPSVPPADRAWMGKLVTAVSNAGALAIAVDFYFMTPTKPDKDEALTRAIRNSKAPVVLAAVGNSSLKTESQRKFLKDFIERTGGRAGHIGLKKAKEIFSLGDRATRGVYHDDPNQGYPSLTSVLANLPEVQAAYGKHAVPEGQQRIDWLLKPESGPAFARYSAQEILSPKPGAPAPDLKGKIVLIGPDFPLQDQHTLPFAIGKEKGTFFPGVFVHAQALAQILDERFFHSWSSAQQFLLLFLVGLLGAAAGGPFHGMRADFLVGIVGSLLIIGLSVPFFLAHMPFPTALAILAWGAAIWTGERVQAWRE
jgi:CHASE2 domain-containing sensor protein